MRTIVCVFASKRFVKWEMRNLCQLPRFCHFQERHGTVGLLYILKKEVSHQPAAISSVLCDRYIIELCAATDFDILLLASANIVVQSRMSTVYWLTRFVASPPTEHQNENFCVIIPLSFYVFRVHFKRYMLHAPTAFLLLLFVASWSVYY